jgi:hypothetical protein
MISNRVLRVHVRFHTDGTVTTYIGRRNRLACYENVSDQSMQRLTRLLDEQIVKERAYVVLRPNGWSVYPVINKEA